MHTTEQLNTALAGRYAIDHLVGEGGMATVYLAHDLKHHRKVALKVLKPDLGAVVGVDRFLAEIQVTASLQHPNLLPLFDSGEAGGLLFYVMPFVDGESLRARLDREKQLPIDESVRIAVALAGALEYAHEHGVIHRDMKPENVLLQAGQPVITDFGIALAVSNAGGARVTQTGLSLGTPQYMSPEQATGDRVIDGRTDIYSLAAMTYEMITGEPPHTGTSAQAIIAKLMTEDVRPLTVLRRSVPAHIDSAVRHGLERLAADRFPTASDFALALTGARPFIPLATSDQTAATSPRTRLVIASLAGIAAGAMASAAWFATRPTPHPSALPTARFPLVFPDSVRLASLGGTKLALSRDGTKIVFVGEQNGRRALYLRRIDDPVGQPVRGGDLGSTGGAWPTFSPQGDWMLFRINQVLKMIPVAGGTAQTLADSSGSASLGDQGVFLFTRRHGLWIGSSDRRDAHLVADPDTAHGIFDFSFPEILPGGTCALVTIDRAPGPILDSMRLGVVDLKSGTVTDLGSSGSNPHYVSSGHILFARSGGRVFVVPFSLRKRAITGTESLLLDNVWQGAGGATDFSVSDNGTIVYREGTASGTELVAVTRTGKVSRLPGEAMNFLYPRISPDGRAIAINVVTRDARWGVSLVDATTGGQELLAAPDSGRDPEWTRDGVRVVLARRVGGVDEYISRARDRSGADTVLARAKAVGNQPLHLVLGAPHGLAVTTRNTGSSRFALYLTPMDSMGVFRPFGPGSASNHSPSVSADGRLLAWVSNESGTNQVYVQPMVGGARIPVSVNGGSEPLWSRSGKTLFYRAPSSVMSAEIDGSPLRVTRRDSLFADPFLRRPDLAGRQWDAFPDGKQFLMLRPVEGEMKSVFVVLNWRSQFNVSPSSAARP